MVTLQLVAALASVALLLVSLGMIGLRLTRAQRAHGRVVRAFRSAQKAADKRA